MKTNSALILIVEDDESLGQSLKEGLSREGHQVHLASKPDDAFDLVEQHKFDFVLTDCLLPQMTGVDFLLKVRKEFPQLQAKTILMSGIYSDKAFIQESLQKTQSVAFLKKPFDLSELTKLVKKDDNTIKAASTFKSTYQFFTKVKMTAKEKRHLIESFEEISGYDLPLVYSILSETKSSGYLNIYSQDGTISGVTFSSGSVISVDIEDKNTYLGEMLIQGGFIKKQDLEVALTNKSKKKLGAKLIQMNLVSPHAFDLIMAEQMNIRLSRTITQETLKINFATSDVEYVPPAIDSDLLVQYLHDWIVSKIPSLWFKKLFFSWLGRRVQLSALYKSDHIALQMPLIESLNELVQNIQMQPTIAQLVSSTEYNPVAVLKCLHFLSLKGLIFLSEKTQEPTQQLEQLAVLKSMKILTQELAAADLKEILDWSDANFIVDLKTMIGSKPLAADSELKSLWDYWSQFIQNHEKNTSHQSESTTSSRSLRKRSQEEQAEAKFKSQQLIESMKQDLQLNQFAKAKEKFTQAIQLDPSLHQAQLFSAWIKLGMLDKNKNKNIQLKEVEIELVQTPPDEKYDSLYPFVQGLFLKAKGDYVNAKKALEKSVAMDGSFLAARRELGHLSTLDQPKQDLLNMDLKQVMTGLFKKKA